MCKSSAIVNSDPLIPVVSNQQISLTCFPYALKWGEVKRRVTIPHCVVAQSMGLGVECSGNLVVIYRKGWEILDKREFIIDDVGATIQDFPAGSPVYWYCDFEVAHLLLLSDIERDRRCTCIMTGFGTAWRYSHENRFRIAPTAGTICVQCVNPVVVSSNMLTS